jgi:CheY-like chemotaxis protein
VQVEETTPLNVVIVDDHVALRRGMELLLRRAGHHVVGTADDAEAGGALILRWRPDVALVDLALPGMSGAELTRSLLKENADLRIVLYTGAADERQLLDALDAGAAGFALKSGGPAGARGSHPGGRGRRRLHRPAPHSAPRQGRERPDEAAFAAGARDSRPALAGAVRRGGRAAALPLLRDRPHARAKRDGQARRGDPRPRCRAGPPARRDLSVGVPRRGQRSFDRHMSDPIRGGLRR